ncbi:MAG: S-layer protein [Cyanobacteria bacterium QS_8_64_29]|nr:MAG: S-layer protein [Cyanobacteria bacterium QS_8_64_29]
MRQPLLALSLLALLSACGSGGSMQELFQADPKLKTDRESEQQQSSDSKDGSAPTEANAIPQAIPRYPNAELVEAQSQTRDGDERGRSRWRTADTVDEVLAFYSQAFQQGDWTPIEGSQQSRNTVAARQQDLRVTVTIPFAHNGSSQETDRAASDRAPADGAASEQATTFAIRYQFGTQQAAADSSDAENGSQTDADSGQQASLSRLENEQWRQKIRDLAALGVFTTGSGNQNADSQPDLSNFQPNRPIARDTFAQWLLRANNRIYAGQPGKQVRPVSSADRPAFSDVPSTHPAFGPIQGLAEAGLIASRLSGDAGAAAFNPDNPLSRATLLAWKVPLDVRQGLPSASVEAIQQEWGFQDADSIPERVRPAVLADAQLGERSNIRHVLGYTRLLQPQKAVTRAQAAIALWSFGGGEQARTAAEARQSRSTASEGSGTDGTGMTNGNN